MNDSIEWKTFFDAVAVNDVKLFRDFVETHRINLKLKNSQRQTAAHIAAKNGNLQILQYLLDREPSLVRVKDIWDQTVFHMAVEYGALDVVKYLDEMGNANVFESNIFFPGSTAIHIAAAVGKLDVFKYFVEQKKMNVDLKNESGQPPSFSAAARNRLHVVQYLVEQTKANLTAIDDNGDNILFITARTGELEIPKYLLDEKKMTFDIDWRNNVGETIVNRASVFNNYNFVEYVVGDKHANVNIGDRNGNTPLHEAAEIGDVLLVKYLVKNGANPRAKNHHGKIPIDVTKEQKVRDYLSELSSEQRRRRNAPSNEWEDIFEAAEHGDLPAVKEFIEERCVILQDANPIGETVVHIAARNVNFAILNYMLDRAPSLVSAKDMQTNTPLHLATRNNRLEVIKYLLDERKADLLETNYIHLGNTALHIAAEIGNLTIVKYFVEDKGVDVNLKNDVGQSPIFCAASYGRMDIVKYLLEERKADVAMTDVNDDNILYVMARTGDVNLTKYLLDEQKVEFDINRRDKHGETLVHRASRFGRLSLIKYLVEEKGADVNRCDKNNRSPLHEAACLRHTDLVKYLMQRGADPEAKDRWGRTHTDDDTFRELMDEWRKTNAAKRERRNVLPGTPSSFYEESQKAITSHRIPARDLLNGNLNPTIAHTSLILADVCVRYFKGSTYRRAKRGYSEALLSPREILLNRIDPRVVDAISSGVEFAQPLYVRNE